MCWKANMKNKTIALSLWYGSRDIKKYLYGLNQWGAMDIWCQFFDYSDMDNKDMDTTTGPHALTRSTGEEEEKVTYWQWIQGSVEVKRHDDDDGKIWEVTSNENKFKNTAKAELN